MIVSGKPGWVTIPIVRAYHGLRTVREMQSSPDPTWRGKVLRTIELSYRRAPYFGEVYPMLEGPLRTDTPGLADYNLAAIHAICDRLGLTTPIVIGSSLAVDGRATDLLIRMVKAVTGTAYLAGGGSREYQEDHKFQEAGINLIYQEFQHPTYPQFNTSVFQPGLSIVDSLMNCGFAGTSELLTGTR
jgi:hypothetical protein